MRGKCERPNISTGWRPSYHERSSSTACAVEARLCTHSAMSSSYSRMWAKIFGFSGTSACIVPSPKTGCSLRSAMSRRIQRSSDVGVRSWASTFLAW